MSKYLLYLLTIPATLVILSVIYLTIATGPCFYWFQVGQHKMQLSAYNMAKEYFTKNKSKISDTHFVCEIKGVSDVIKKYR